MTRREDKIGIGFVRIDKIVKDERNPKDHDIGTIISSIGRFGFVTPLVVDEATGKLVAGHGRAEAARVMSKDKKYKTHPPAGIKVDSDGAWMLPVITGVEMENEQEALAYMLADNRLTEIGGWYDNELACLLSELDDLTGVGWDEDEVDKMLKALQEGEGEGEEEEKDIEVIDESMIEIGDVWKIGDHTFVGCGTDIFEPVSRLSDSTSKIKIVMADVGEDEEVIARSLIKNGEVWLLADDKRHAALAINIAAAVIDDAPAIEYRIR